MMQVLPFICLRDKSKEKCTLQPRCPVLMSSSSQCEGDGRENYHRKSLHSIHTTESVKKSRSDGKKHEFECYCEINPSACSIICIIVELVSEVKVSKVFSTLTGICFWGFLANIYVKMSSNTAVKLGNYYNNITDSTQPNLLSASHSL